MILGAWIALAVLQVAAKVMALALALMLLTSALLRPCQTLAFLAGLTILGLIGRYPLVALPSIAALAVLGRWSEAKN